MVCRFAAAWRLERARSEGLRAPLTVWNRGYTREYLAAGIFLRELANDPIKIYVIDVGEWPYLLCPYHARGERILRPNEFAFVITHENSREMQCQR